MTVSFGTLVPASEELTSFQYLVLVSSGARRPMPAVGFFAEVQLCTRLVTSALIQPSFWQPVRPAVSFDEACLEFQAGCDAHREAVEARPVSYTSQA